MKVPNQLRCGARILLVLSLSACERIGFTLVDADAGRGEDTELDGAVSESASSNSIGTTSESSAVGDGLPDADASNTRDAARTEPSDAAGSETSTDSTTHVDAVVADAATGPQEDTFQGDDAGNGIDPLDSDGDGLPDLVDEDDDDDGFSDLEEEVALTDPLDPRSPNLPNHYPGSILSDPCVQLAIAEYDVYRADHGMSPFVVNLEHRPSDVAGYYRGHQSDGELETSWNGEYGRYAFGVEYGYRALPDGDDDRYETWGVGYQDREIQFSWYNKLSIVRGSDDSFTSFGNQETQVVIATTEHRNESGSRLDNYELWVSVDPTGEYPQGMCTLGDWVANHWSVHTRLAGAEITYMCSDGVDGYIPEMQWQSGAETCTCIDGLELEESCVDLADAGTSTDVGSSGFDAGNSASSDPADASGDAHAHDE